MGKQHGENENKLTLLLPLSIILTGYMLHKSRQKKGEIAIGGEEELDWAKLLLHLALWLNFLALFFYYFGFAIYAYGSGSQYGFFDFMYLLFHSFSEALVTGLLIFIAFGWTITFLKTADYDLYVPLSNSYREYSWNARTSQCDPHIVDQN